MGAASASEEISDDVAAIEPTDDLIVESVDEEATDDLIVESVDEEATDDLNAETVEEQEEIKSNDIDDVLSDNQNFFYLESLDADGKNDPVFYVSIQSSGANQNGTLNVIVNDETEPRSSYGIENGRFLIYGSDYGYYPTNSITITPFNLGLTKGEYNLTLSLIQKGAETFSTTAKIKFMDFPFTVSFMNPQYPDAEALRVTSNTNEEGTLEIFVNDETEARFSYPNTNEDTYISKNFKTLGLEEGAYNLTVRFIQNGEESFRKTGEVHFYMEDYVRNSFSVYMPDTYEPYHGFALIDIYSQGNRNGTLYIFLNDALKMEYSINNGYFNSSYDDTRREIDIDQHQLKLKDPGVYKVKVSFYDNSLDKELIIVEKNVLYMPISFSDYYQIGDGEDLPFAMKFPDGVTGNVRIYETEYDYNLDDYVKIKILGSAKIVNGFATVELPRLGLGSHRLLIEFSTSLGNGNMTYETAVYKTFGNIVATVSPEIQVGSNAIITVNNDVSGDLTIYIDGEKIAIYDVSSFKYVIPDLTVGTHIVRIVFEGNYLGRDYEKSLNLYDSYYINSFKINVKAPAVKPAATKTATKIIAAKKTFKVNAKVKKYTITLKTKAGKTIKKAKVTLKVKGKTYKATTNSKGKATFKIKNLKKKGKYIATIKFAATKLYKASSKKAKITVKK